MARPDNSILTKDYLASELRKITELASPENAVKYEALATRAETGEFDDYADVHVCGPTALYCELMSAGFTRFTKRVANGEFDATQAEAEAWARSQSDPEIVKILNAMGAGPDRGKDH